MSYRAKVLGALVAGLGILYVVRRIAASRLWGGFQTAEFWQSFLQVSPPYLLLAVALIFASYFFRSLRWREFLRPLRAGRLLPIYIATLVGFSAVALFARPGEVVRPWLIARKEGLPVSSQLGAWALERVFDSLTLGGLLGVALLWLPSEHPLADGQSALSESFRKAGLVLFLGAVLLGVLVLAFRRRQTFFLALLRRVTRPLPHRYQAALQRMFEHFSMGLAGMDSLAGLLRCTLHSLLVWLTLLLAYGSVARAMGGPMSRLGWEAISLVMAASAVGSLAHLPGVGGGTQVASIVALTEVFGIPLAVATSAAILFWAVSFLAVLLPGLPLAAREGLSWQRLRRVAREGL